jgi:hypothetical protein
MLNEDDYLFEILMLRREVRYTKRFLVFCVIFYSFVFLVFIYFTYHVSLPKIDTEFSYQNLTNIQIQKTKNWINDIKPQYLKLVRNITFTNVQNFYHGNLTVVGLNKDNDIYILLTGDDCFDFGTLRHEIAHSWENPYLSEQDREWFAEDVETSDLMEVRKIC